MGEHVCVERVVLSDYTKKQLGNQSMWGSGNHRKGLITVDIMYTLGYK